MISSTVPELAGFNEIAHLHQLRRKIADLLLVRAFNTQDKGMCFTQDKSLLKALRCISNIALLYKIGALSLEDSSVIPIDAKFSSLAQENANSLGHGWSMPLIDSNAIIVGEDTIRAMLPDGRILNFKKNRNTSILTSRRGWAGEIKGDEIYLTSECGTKVRYTKGRIVQLEAKNGKIYNWEYVNRRAVRIYSLYNNETLCKIDYNENSNIKEIQLGLTSISFKYDAKPIIQTISGQRVVGYIAQALASISIDKVPVAEYSYDLDNTLSPLIRENISGLSKTITWDPDTTLISSENKCRYNITRDQNGNLLSLEKVAASGLTQLIETSGRAANTEIIQDNSGNKISTEYIGGFSRLSNRARVVVIEKNGIDLSVTKNYFDEAGRTIKSIEAINGKKNTTLHFYDSKSRLTSTKVNGVTVESRNYNKDGTKKHTVFTDKGNEIRLYSNEGRLLSFENAQGIIHKYSYASNGVLEEVRLSNGHVTSYIRDELGRLTAIKKLNLEEHNLNHRR